MEQTFSHWPAVPAAGVRVRLAVMSPHECSYLPGRECTVQGAAVGRADPEAYEAMLDAGFRRSGRVVYQPVCVGCRECVPMRMDVGSFVPSKSQRRVWRRNEDLAVDVGELELTKEKVELYSAYLTGQHAKEVNSAEVAEDLEGFLYQSPVATAEVTYRDRAGKLLAVGIIDVTPEVLSSVYFFWDPAAARRSLGIYGVLREMEIAKQAGKRWYHLGYWVKGSNTMDYKASVGDHELLGTDGVWRQVGRNVVGG